ncbi:beta-glucosidase [Rhizobium sp. 2YAF20]|uniref:beta-glucosidase family protein n=1 Tax=Rhizobium sp. 2YAF20 TaxID=3233027 RepID=UPI003F950171
MNFDQKDRDLLAIVDSLTDVEKVDLVSGHGLWKSKANYRTNIPEIVMTDGTYGVRYSVSQIEENPEGENTALQQFLAVVNQRASEGASGVFGSTRKATCFPNGSLLACCWDIDLGYRLGEALARECQEFGVHLLLGPGINIRRMPLAGRSYEYYSEDPVVSGEIAASVINGLQDNGVGASLKHFACNNSEIERTTMSSDVDERALREIYLAGFERAISKSRPWSVMSAYNRINGVQAAENEWLLNTVLRQEWGYEGLVISDWHGIKDRPASIRAGNDLDMPESRQRKASLLDAISSGKVSRETIDAACFRMLRLIQKVRAGAQKDFECDFEAHHELAREMAAESLVLLKNKGSTLPLQAQNPMRMLVVGDWAIDPIIQGSGSATTNPTRIDRPLDEIVRLAGEKAIIRHIGGPAIDDLMIAEAVRTAAEMDVVIVFASAETGSDGEGSDRRSMSLACGQDQLISALAANAAKVVVVLAIPDAVEMPWIDEVDAVVAAFYGGQGCGEAIARVLFGLQNPCGKLTVTFPRRLEDVPGFHSYPGESDRHCYSEGIFVGYRYYDLKQIAPIFPFGHGLSYTSFDYSNLEIDTTEITSGQSVKAMFQLKNSGNLPGKEVVQLYVRPVVPGAKRPVRELKGFCKVALKPGETQSISIALSPRDFQYYDTHARRWVLRGEAFHIEIASSSRDIKLSAELHCRSEAAGYRRLTTESQPMFVLANGLAVERLVTFISESLSVSDTDARKMLELTRSSFLGIFNTLSWYVGDALSEQQLQLVLDEINAGNGSDLARA